MKPWVDHSAKVSVAVRQLGLALPTSREIHAQDWRRRAGIEVPVRDFW